MAIRFGEEHGRAKLTRDEVVEIRKRYKEGGVSFVRLAEDYDVTPTTIRYIVTRRIWRHLP